MRFITKDEFEKAIETIDLAVKNGQVLCGHHDRPVEIEEATYVSKDGGVVSSTQLSFVSPFLVAKRQLVNIRNMLLNARQQSASTQKAVEELEKTEKELAALVPTLKE